MINGKSVLAVIPARGGSKRLPNKNIRPLQGKPLIGWTIEAAQKSNIIDRTIVSTDSDEIARISKSFNVDIPFQRPAHLATDEAQTSDVLLHVLDFLKDSGEVYDYLTVLQPTSPLRTAKHIDDALMLMHRRNAIGIVSVCPVDHPTEWCNTLPPNGSMDRFIDKNVLGARSQDLPERYRINGAIYAVDVHCFSQQQTLLLSNDMTSFIMKREDSIDIDTEYDFTLVEYLIKMDDVRPK